MNHLSLLLFDLRPDPVPVAGPGGLILLAFVVLMLTVALIVGLVFLLKRLKGVSSPTVREGLSPLSVSEQPQPSNPNQP